MVTQALIERCVKGDAKAQHELYRAMHASMLSICTRYERNRQDAVALMNQGFLRILRGLADRRPSVPFEPWARRIVINTVIDAFRRSRPRRENETLTDRVDDHAGTSTNDYLREMEAEAFAELLRRLPPVTRQVFNLFAIDGCSHAEVGDLLGISEGTSKWHVNHARTILRRALAVHEERNRTRTINEIR